MIDPPQAEAPPDRPTPPRDRWAHRRGEPRIFAFIWTIFLFAATATIFVFAFSSGTASPEVIRPATRLLLAVMMAGIVLVWPLIRLSQAVDRHPVAGVMQDLVVVLIPAQAVVWPQWFTWLGRWPFSVIAAISALSVAWAFLAGALLSLAHSSHLAAALRAAPDRPVRWPAGVWMLAFVILALGGAAPLMLGEIGVPAAADPVPPPFRAAWMCSPISAVYELTRDRAWSGVNAAVEPAHWRAIGWVAAAAAPLWLAALMRAHGVKARAGLH
jgi:hypothetical protein